MIFQKKKKKCNSFWWSCWRCFHSILVLHCLISTWGSIVCFSLIIFEQSKDIQNKIRKKKNSLNKVYFSMFRNNNNSKWMSLLLWMIAISLLYFCILILWSVQKYLVLKIIHFLALLIYIIVFQFGYLLFFFC